MYRGTGGLMMGEDMNNYGRLHLERNDLSLVSPESRQIYLTFPADSEVPDTYRKLQQQQMDRGFSPCGTPTAIDCNIAPYETLQLVKQPIGAVKIDLYQLSFRVWHSNSF